MSWLSWSVWTVCWGSNGFDAVSCFGFCGKQLKWVQWSWMKIVWKLTTLPLVLATLMFHFLHWFFFFCLNFCIGQLKSLKAALDNDSCRWLVSVVAALCTNWKCPVTVLLLLPMYLAAVTSWESQFLHPELFWKHLPYTFMKQNLK